MGRLSGIVTQGSADAFAQASIQTSLEGQTTRGYDVKEVVFEFGAVALAALAQDIEVQLSRRTKAAMALITDVDILFKFKEQLRISTSGAWVFDNVFRWVPQIQTIIVEDPIFLAVDSTASGAAISVSVEVFYDDVTLSEVDRLTLLTQSLV